MSEDVPTKPGLTATAVGARTWFVLNATLVSPHFAGRGATHEIHSKGR